MKVSVISDNQVENFIKFLMLNNGKVTNLYAYLEKYDPYSMEYIINDKNIILKTEIINGDIVINNKLTIPKKHMNTLYVFERGFYSFCVKYRDDENEIHYTFEFSNAHKESFNKPECTNFFVGDKDYSHYYVEHPVGI